MFKEITLWYESLSATGKVKLLSIALAVFSLLIYSYSIGNEFVWDSSTFFLDDPTIRDSSHIASYFTERFSSFIVLEGADRELGYYRPFIKLLHLAEYSLFSESAWGYNLVSVLLNMTIMVLAFVFLLNETGSRKIAILASLLYAAHPIRVEAVSWAYSDSYLVFALFLFLIFNFYSKRRMTLAGTTFILALFSRETAVLVPVAIAMYEFLIRGSRRWRDYLPAGVFLLITAAFLFIRSLVVGAVPLPGLNAITFLNTVVFVIAKFIKIAFVPDSVIALYQNRLFESITPGVAVSYAVVFTSIAIAIALARKSHRALFWYLWFFLWLTPSLNVGQLGDFLMAEKLLHISVLGFCVLAAMGVDISKKYKKETIAIFTLVFFMFSGLLVYRTFFWHDTVRFLERSLRYDPDFARVQYTLGRAYVSRKQYDSALESFQIAVELEPRFSDAHSSIGNVYIMRGDEDEAIKAWKASIAGDPVNPIPYYNIGLVLEQNGRLREAMDYYSKYLSLHPAPSGKSVMRIQALEMRLSDLVSQ